MYPDGASAAHDMHACTHAKNHKHLDGAPHGHDMHTMWARTSSLRACEFGGNSRRWHDSMFVATVTRCCPNSSHTHSPHFLQSDFGGASKVPLGKSRCCTVLFSADHVASKALCNSPTSPTELLALATLRACLISRRQWYSTVRCLCTSKGTG